MEEARLARLTLQESQARRKSSLVLRLIRGGLCILATALALQQVCPAFCCELLFVCLPW